MTFHRELGSYRDKAARLARLVDGPLAASLDDNERRAAHDAAQLAKADLTTLMVREFPELQGVMGALYLKAAGAPRRRRDGGALALPSGLRRGRVRARPRVRRRRDVAGVRRRLRRGQAGHAGRLLRPRARARPAAAILSACAARGRARSARCSTSGPRGRAGGGPSLRTLIAAALDGYEGRLKKPRTDVERDLEAFLLDRMRYVLVTRGFAADEVEAVLAAREPDALDDPQEALQRVRALHRVRLEATEDFDHLAVAFKRARNILAGQAPAAVDRALLGEAAERELHEAVGRLQGIDGGYEARLRSLAGAARARRSLLRRRDGHGGGPEGAGQPAGPALAGPVALLSHRGHLETRRLGWLDTSTSSAAARRTATRT